MEADFDRATSARGTAQFETALFWVAYVSTAFEAAVHKDRDPAKEKDEEGNISFSLGSTFSSEYSFIYFETIRDARDIRPDDTFEHYAISGDEEEQRARTTVHEIGHQLLMNDKKYGRDLGGHRNSKDNIMNETTFDVPADKFYFHEIDVRELRDRVNSPGTM